jgi:hypothetical protein
MVGESHTEYVRPASSWATRFFRRAFHVEVGTDTDTDTDTDGRNKVQLG